MVDRPTIGVLTPLIGGFYYANILSGVQRTARRRGARVVAFQTSGMDMVWPEEQGTLPLAWDRIDGFLGINNHEGRAYYDRKRSEGRSKQDALRCLKRRISDRIFQALRRGLPA